MISERNGGVKSFEVGDSAGVLHRFIDTRADVNEIELDDELQQVPPGVVCSEHYQPHFASAVTGMISKFQTSVDMGCHILKQLNEAMGASCGLQHRSEGLLKVRWYLTDLKFAGHCKSSRRFGFEKLRRCRMVLVQPIASIIPAPCLHAVISSLTVENVSPQQDFTNRAARKDRG